MTFAKHESQVCILTGGSSGIGLCFGRMLAEQGYRLVLIGRNERQLTDHFTRPPRLSLRGDAAPNLVIPADLSRRGEGARAARQLLEAGLMPSAIVHCAGGSLGVKDALASEDDFRHVWEVNANQLIAINAEIVPVMRQNGFGRILHLTSVSAEKTSGSIAYSAAKAYLNAYVRSAGRQFARSGVLVNAISLSAIAAEGNNWSRAMLQNSPSVVQQLERGQAVQKLGTVEDLEAIAMFLLSERNTYTTGSILSLDGGTL